MKGLCSFVVGLIALVCASLPAQAQFSATQTWLGTAGGTANALAFSIHNISTLNDLLGVPLRFIPASANTNAVTITINLDGGGSLGPLAIERPTSNIGLQQLSGAEFQTGQSIQVTYNGTVFEITSPWNMAPIGHSVEFRGSTAPKGTLIEDGSCYSQTQYAALFSVIGSTYNSAAPVACTTGFFAVPDSRGSTFSAEDNQGANGAANRLTSAGSGCTATGPTLCGSQNQTLARAHLPNTSISMTSGNGGITDPGHSHVIPYTVQVAGSGGAIPAGNFITQVGNPSTNTSTTGISAQFNLNGNVTQQTLTTLPPTSVGLRAIKY